MRMLGHPWAQVIALLEHDPSDFEYVQAILRIAETADETLSSFPEWHRRLMTILITEFGLHAPHDF